MRVVLMRGWCSLRPRVCDGEATRCGSAFARNVACRARLHCSVRAALCTRRRLVSASPRGAVGASGLLCRSVERSTSESRAERGAATGESANGRARG